MQPMRRTQRATRASARSLVFRRPQQLASAELPLGWSLDAHRPLGFAPARRTSASPQLAAYAGDGHTMVVARTGSGKGRSCAIPWLLHHDNAAIVLDVKGEAYECTSAYRRERLGHHIYVLDPFGLVGGADALNPFDLVRADKVDIDADVITELVIDGKPTSKVDAFWDNMSRALLLGAVAHVATAHAEPTFAQLRDLLQGDDVAATIDALLDAGKVQSPLARREFTTWRNHEGEKVRNSVLSTAQQHLRTFASESVLRSLGRSTIPLDEVLRGERFTIYLVVPPENLASHGAALRLWLGTLLHVLTRRKRMPRTNTLFLLDEIAQCGRMSALRQAITLMRGYGVTTLTLWQDLAQLQTTYEEWRTLLNNSAVLMTFGAANFEMATAMANVIGVPPQRLMALPADHALVTIAGEEPFEVRRLDYLVDRWLQGRATPNPRFGARGRS